MSPYPFALFPEHPENERIVHTVISTSHGSLDLEPKPRVQPDRALVVPSDNQRHALQALLHERVVKQGPDNTLPAPPRARGSKGQLAVKLSPAMIDRTGNQLSCFVRNPDRRERPKIINRDRMRQLTNHEIGNVLILVKYKLQTRPAGFMTIADDLQLTPWLVNETRNLIEAE